VVDANTNALQFSMAEVKAAFAAFDLDKNSFVGAAELRSVYSALGEEVTDDEVRLTLGSHSASLWLYHGTVSLFRSTR
jgi:Ca2+-binding EF-hand superfamily protein